MEKTGDLCEIRREIKFEWKIKDFLLLSDKTNTNYGSPEFSFSGTSWKIDIYPSGHTKNKSEGWVSLYVTKMTAGCPVTVDWSFSLKTRDGKTFIDEKGINVFEEKDSGFGFSEFIRRSELIERKSSLLPSGILTVICTLKNRGKYGADENEVSKKVERKACIDEFAQTNEGTGVWELQHHLREIFLNGNISDVVLKVDDQEFKSHRCILAARSPVFLGMLTHEMKEKNSSVVDIPDADPNTFSDFLNYLYTGSKENVTSQNVVDLFTAADKYQVDDLREVCVDYMLENLSVDNFCDFLTLSLRHVEKDLTDACSHFFMENSLDIILTSKWQILLSENPIACNELHIKQLQLNKLKKLQVQEI